MYEDKDGLRKEEIQSMTGPNEFNEFYARLRNIKDFYKKHPNEISVPLSLEYDEFVKLRKNGGDVNLVDFSDEEGYGKFLDLNECFQKYLNIKGIERIDYLHYLTTFDQLFDISKERKSNQDYRDYLSSLHEYLYEYCLKVKPLLDMNEIMEKVSEEFEKQWEKDAFPGWPVSV